MLSDVPVRQPLNMPRCSNTQSVLRKTTPSSVRSVPACDSAAAEGAEAAEGGLPRSVTLSNAPASVPLVLAEVDRLVEALSGDGDAFFDAHFRRSEKVHGMKKRQQPRCTSGGGAGGGGAGGGTSCGVDGGAAGATPTRPPATHSTPGRKPAVGIPERAYKLLHNLLCSQTPTAARLAVLEDVLQVCTVMPQPQYPHLNTLTRIP